LAVTGLFGALVIIREEQEAPEEERKPRWLRKIRENHSRD
jgi:hypothetical protein